MEQDYINGLMELDMKVNTKKILQMDKGHIILRMEIYIRVNGNIIKDMEKVN